MKEIFFVLAQQPTPPPEVFQGGSIPGYIIAGILIVLIAIILLAWKTLD